MTGHLLSLNSYHYRRGGSDVVYFDHAELFEEKGWRNNFLSMNHPKNTESADSEHFVELVDYEFARSPLEKIRTAAASIYNMEARNRARKMVQTHRFSVAHAHCIYHHLTPSIFPVLSEAGVPVVLTAHDLKIACPAYKMMNHKGICEDCRSGDLTNVIRNRCIKGSRAASAVVWAEAQLHRWLGSYRDHVSTIVTPSLFYREKLIEWGVPEKKLVHIPNFTRTIDPAFRGDYTGSILFFGRLSEEKGLETLIEAARKSGVQVDIAGTGPLEQKLRALAQGAPVRFLGRLDGDALWNAVGRARAIVLPSEWYENAPMSVLEGYQLDRPLIGAEIGGIPELVETAAGTAGWLFASGDADALAERLVEVTGLPDAELVARGQAGRALALGRFSRESYYEAMSDLYASLRQDGGHSRPYERAQDAYSRTGR